MQYLIVDEILLARVMEQRPAHMHTEDTDEESIGEETEEYFDDDTEYHSRKGRPVIM
jgi:hypothetical protein